MPTHSPAYVPILGVVGLVIVLAFRARALIRQWRTMPERAAARAAALPPGTKTLDMYDPWQRMGRGALFGLVIPGVFTILILIMYLTGGRYQTDNKGTTDALALLIAYPIGSALMGAVIGLAFPRMRATIPAALIGMAAVAPLMAGVSASIDSGFTHWDSEHTVIASVMTVVFGAALGIGVARSRSKVGAPESTVR